MGKVRPLVVTPDLELEGQTTGKGGFPVLKFVYRPFTSREFMTYVDKLKAAGESFEKLGAINYVLLAKHVIRVEWPDKTPSVGMDFTKKETWEAVAPEVIFDMVAEIAGMANPAADGGMEGL